MKSDITSDLSSDRNRSQTVPTEALQAFHRNPHQKTFTKPVARPRRSVRPLSARGVEAPRQARMSQKGWLPSSDGFRQKFEMIEELERRQRARSCRCKVARPRCPSRRDRPFADLALTSRCRGAARQSCHSLRLRKRTSSFNVLRGDVRISDRNHLMS